MTSTKRTTGLASLSLAVLLTLLMGTPALAHGNDVSPVPPSAASAPAAPSKTSAEVTSAKVDVQRTPVATSPGAAKDIYAARESKDLEKFRGGDVVVIGSTTVLVVLLVVLIIVVVS
jgi:hypothetical protein